jgi:Ca2+-binding EF-hand superfamily protein
MDLEYTVTENVVRSGAGQVTQIYYEFEETVVIETPVSASTSAIKRKNTEKRNRTYNATITREAYQSSARQTPNALPFDAFVNVLRPFIMGYYTNDELQRAFQTLDRDHSGTIHLEELNSFLPILNDTITADSLHEYVRKVDSDFNGTLNYDEFRSLVLRGIGRDIICNHL